MKGLTGRIGKTVAVISIVGALAIGVASLGYLAGNADGRKEGRKNTIHGFRRMGDLYFRRANYYSTPKEDRESFLKFSGSLDRTADVLEASDLEDINNALDSLTTYLTRRVQASGSTQYQTVYPNKNTNQVHNPGMGTNINE